MNKILLIQTAFIGDVVLATSLIEALHLRFPQATIDFLLRKGNEGLLRDHPHLRKVLIWDKKQQKYRNIWKLLLKIRREHYDSVITIQRFATSGWLTAFSGAKMRIGFSKNPFFWGFSHRITHQIGQGLHEVERNLHLLQPFGTVPHALPKLYPSKKDFEVVPSDMAYVCIAPSSVWFTKQWPREKWVALIQQFPHQITVFLLGGKGDIPLCEQIKTAAKHPNVVIKAGSLSLLESAALMSKARMNYTNDSAPLHFASAMNAPITAIYCSTIPEFGFTPLSDEAHIVETALPLTCRPCGLHGKSACPEGHFKCSSISIDQLSLDV